MVRHGDGNNWRYANYETGEEGDVNAVLIGRIPYQNIAAVDWDGDEYYHFPHIYCYFDGERKQPYEELVFCIEKCNSGGRPFYVEIASNEQVRKLSKKLGIRR